MLRHCPLHRKAIQAGKNPLQWSREGLQKTRKRKNIRCSSSTEASGFTCFTCFTYTFLMYITLHCLQQTLSTASRTHMHRWARRMLLPVNQRSTTHTDTQKFTNTNTYIHYVSEKSGPPFFAITSAKTDQFHCFLHCLIQKESA